MIALLNQIPSDYLSKTLNTAPLDYERHQITIDSIIFICYYY